MSPDQIKQLVIAIMNSQSSPYSVGKVPHHIHNGIDAPKVNQDNITPGVRASANITFAQSTQYKLGITFNPTSVWFYGEAVHVNGMGTVDIHAHCVGSAQLGASFYFSADTSTSVKAPGQIQNLTQSTSSLVIDVATPIILTTSEEDFVIRVYYPDLSTTVAQAQITSFDTKEILVTVNLASGWKIVGNYVVS
jgi:hypothetical protein